MAQKTYTSNTAASNFGTGSNYDDNAAPASGDTVVFTSIGTGSITQGLSQTNIAAITLDFRAGYTGSVGTESSGSNGASYLTLGATGAQVLYVGRNLGGSGGNGMTMGLFNLPSTNGATVFGYRTGSATNNYPPVTLKGAAMTLHLYGGEYGFCVRPGEAGTLSAVSLDKASDYANGSPVLRIGKGAVVPSVMNVANGQCYSSSTNTATTINVIGAGTKYVAEPDNSGAHTNINIEEGATVTYLGTGAISAATIRANCQFDASQDTQSGKQFGTFHLYEGAVLNLDNGANGTITGTGGGTNLVSVITYCDPEKVKINIPSGMSISLQRA